MITRSSSEISRRQFLAAGGGTLAAACITPRLLSADRGDLVGIAIKHAATTKITVQPLRRNITALLGVGGNIAVLTGADGKLLIDAEIVSARPNVSEALRSINADPTKQLINTSLAFRSHRRKRMASPGRSLHSGAGEYAQTSSQGHARRGLDTHFPGLARWSDPLDRLQRRSHRARQRLHFGSEALLARAYGP
jgi:hypothetical protein